MKVRTFLKRVIFHSVLVIVSFHITVIKLVSLRMYKIYEACMLRILLRELICIKRLSITFFNIQFCSWGGERERDGHVCMHTIPYFQKMSCV